MGVRTRITPSDGGVSSGRDVVPLLFYDDGRLFVDGLEAGYKVIKGQRWHLSPLTRYRFHDFGDAARDESAGELDAGGQLSWAPTDDASLQLEVLSSQRAQTHANLTPTLQLDYGRLKLKQSLRLRWKSAAFNSRYYGLGAEELGSAIDAAFGTQVSLRVFSNLHLLGRGTLTVLDGETRRAKAVNAPTQAAAMLALGFMHDEPALATKLASKHYLRLAYGWGTPADLVEIAMGKGKRDPNDSQLTSLFLGIPLADDLLTLPAAVYLTPGLALHHPSKVQAAAGEYVLAVKMFFTFEWPTRWRLGAAEGLSYASRVPYMERSDIEANGGRPSKLLNYLDFSVDLSLGRLLRVPPMERLWLGYSIHHRSGIYGTSSLLGRAVGGSNYNSLTLQVEW